MGLFKNNKVLNSLFKKKEGGSIIGNLLRGAGDKLTGGFYSTVFKKPTSDTSKDKASDVLKESVNKILENQKKSETMKLDFNKIMEWGKKYWYIPLVVVGGAIWYFFGGKKSNIRKR